MIAIPNIEKPKSCGECPIARSYIDCLMETKYICPIGHPDDCPLIDIVTCEECKRSGTDGEHTFCMWLGALREPTDFCSYGERRSE